MPGASRPTRRRPLPRPAEEKPEPSPEARAAQAARIAEEERGGLDPAAPNPGRHVHAVRAGRPGPACDGPGAQAAPTGHRADDSTPPAGASWIGMARSSQPTPSPTKSPLTLPYITLPSSPRKRPRPRWASRSRRCRTPCSRSRPGCSWPGTPLANNASRPAPARRSPLMSGATRSVIARTPWDPSAWT